MILYALRCEHGHEFEAWFRDGATYDAQAEAGVVVCPICGDTRISKAIMAPSIPRHHGARGTAAGQETAGGPEEDEPSSAAPAAPSPAVPAPATGKVLEGAKAMGSAEQAVAQALPQLMDALDTLRRRVEATCDNVGNAFAEEARRIHYGEAEARGIYGETTLEEAEALRDEGVSFATIPWRRRTNG